MRIGSDWHSELRETNRRKLEPLVTDLGDALYKVVATNVLSVRDQRTKNVEYWRQLKADARKKLRQLRPKLRYPLWGLDDGIKALICLSDWIDSTGNDSILQAATKLRATLDNSIRRCYRFGRPPSLFERLMVNYRVFRMRSEWRGLKDAFLEEDVHGFDGLIEEYEKTYVTVVSRNGDEFIAETEDGEHFKVLVNNRSGKGSRENLQIGVKIKLYKRPGEEFFRYRFVGG
ncbi:MAG: hypothetical protein GY777_00520 [Candidatus Brocadiaceae bacterium]|nr:hypothetical protein [Candidatus Brocadiaceae bacterium]